MIKPFYRPEEPTEPYFLLRAYDLGRIEYLIKELKNEAADLTDIEAVNYEANRILEKVNTISRILREESEE